MFQPQKRLPKWRKRFVKNGFERTRFFVQKFNFCTFWTMQFGSNSVHPDGPRQRARSASASARSINFHQNLLQKFNASVRVRYEVITLRIRYEVIWMDQFKFCQHCSPNAYQINVWRDFRLSVSAFATDARKSFKGWVFQVTIKSPLLAITALTLEVSSLSIHFLRSI